MPLGGDHKCKFEIRSSEFEFTISNGLLSTLEKPPTRRGAGRFDIAEGSL